MLLETKKPQMFLPKPAFKNILLYLRYADDCFVLARSKKIMDIFFNIYNNAHNYFSFTMEKENNNELAFF